MFELVLPGRLQRLAQELARRVGEDDNPLPRQQLCPRLVLDLAPYFMRATHQRHILAALADREARDPGVAVRRAPWMRGRVLVDSYHGHASGRELIARGAAHRTP